MTDRPSSQRSEWWGSSTRWSLVALAGHAVDAAQRSDALAELLEIYREPVRRLLAVHARRFELDDLTPEGFFAYALERDALARADADRGRFRQFIQGVARNYALEERRALVRGRGLPLESPEAETDLWGGDASEAAEADEERAWALGVLEEALTRLAEGRSGDADLVRRRYLDPRFADTEALARRLNTSADTLRRRLSRARERLRATLDEVLRESATSAEDFDAEHAWTVARLMDACPGLLSG